MAFSRFAGLAILGGALWAGPVHMQKEISVTPVGGGVQIRIALDGRVNWGKGTCYVDLMGISSPWGVATHVQAFDSGPIKDITFGSHPDYTRIAIHLQASATCALNVTESAGGLTIDLGGSSTPKVSATATHHTPVAAETPPRVPKARPKATPPPPPPTPEVRTSSAAVPQHAPAPKIDEASVQVSPDLQLSIMEDKSQDLPFVLQMYHGFVGFGDAGSREVQSMFQADKNGEWGPTLIPEGHVPVLAYFALQFNDNRSTLVENLRQKFHVPPDWVAYALFPDSFRDVINQQIRHAAAAEGTTGPITKATIQFAMAEDRGIAVTNLK